jgi:hypothetical protein
MSAALQVRSTSPPIPWHIGMAADRFISDITRTDQQAKDVASALIRQIIDRMERKHGRHSPARPGQLIDIEREWRQRMPQESRLGYTADWQKNRRGEPKGVVIHDFRASALGLRNPRWGDHAEMGLTLILIEARILPDDVRLKVEEQAIVLRHAIARRFERGYPATAEAIIDDLRHIAHTRLTEPTTCVVTTDSGRWMGRLGNYEDKVELLVINTFLGPDMRGDGYYGR